MSQFPTLKPDGQVVAKGWEFFYGLSVNTSANKGEYRLQQDSPLHLSTITGVQVRKLTTNAKGIYGNAIINDTAFVSSYLTLKQRNAQVFERIPLEFIRFATEQGLWYPVLVPEVDMANSSVLCTNEAAITDDEEYVFVFKYIRRITQ